MRTIDSYGAESLFDGPAVYNPRSMRWQPGRDGVNMVALGLNAAKPDGKAFAHETAYWIRPDMDISFTNDIMETMRQYNELMNGPRGITSDGGTTVAPTPMLKHNKVPGQPDTFDPTGVVPGRPDVVDHVKPSVDTPFVPPSAARSQQPVVLHQPAPHVVPHPQPSPHDQAQHMKLQAESLRQQAQKLLDMAAKIEP